MIHVMKVKLALVEEHNDEADLFDRDELVISRMNFSDLYLLIISLL